MRQNAPIFDRKEANMKDTQTPETIATVPLVAFEATASRYTRIIRGLVIAWAGSVLVFGAAISAVLIL